MVKTRFRRYRTVSVIHPPDPVKVHTLPVLLMYTMLYIPFFLLKSSQYDIVISYLLRTSKSLIVVNPCSESGIHYRQSVSLYF